MPLFSKRTVWVVIAALVAEGVAIVALHSRIPRAIRALTALANLAAAAALWLLLRQRERS
jgi:hypothetical protein